MSRGIADWWGLRVVRFEFVDPKKTYENRQIFARYSSAFLARKAVKNKINSSTFGGALVVKMS